MTDRDFAAWLASPTAIRTVLIEAVINVSGSDITRYMSTRAYVTGAADTPANKHYQPIVSTGVKFTEQLSLSGGASLSGGDIEIHNLSGERDSWLEDIWVNRPIQAFIGDPRWARSDFRMIFNGVVADIDSKSRDKLNLLLRDKLQRLNTPVSEVVLGGYTPNKDVVIPLTFGECHNVSPLLTDPVTLEYQVHNGPVKSIFEVRDNGIPVTVVANNATGKFTLSSSPIGAITASVQGDKPAAYPLTVSQTVQRIVTGFGKATDQFTSGDLDAANLAAFDTAHPQPVGTFLNGRENVLTTCNNLASSLGAQISMSRAGLLRLLQIDLPPSGTPRVINGTQMIEHSLHVASRTSVVAAVKIGYCKNWTVQSGLLTAIPVQHKDMFALEWLTATAEDSATKTAYKLNAEPVQQDTMLLVNADAQAEADRRLNLYKVPRTVYQFEGKAELLTLELGDAATLVHPRFGMASGLTGMVVMLSPDWITGHVTVGVLI